jgi:alkaline phosphatase D
MTRRMFLAMAASCGPSLALGSKGSRRPGKTWGERRDLYPQGVASGDPYPDSVLLWTRRSPPDGGEATRLVVEVAEDPDFHRVVPRADARVSAATDWTCRVLAAGLQPAHVYWYRFTDEQGHGSRIGRTITAPSEKDTRPVSFTFVSCQNVQQGAGNAYRPSRTSTRAGWGWSRATSRPSRACEFFGRFVGDDTWR